jgi:hypothetical protein
MDVTFQPLKSMWKAKNIANIIDLLDLLTCPLMNLIGNETL